MNEWTEEQKKAWAAWTSGRPENVREVAGKFPPNRKYKLRGDLDSGVGSYYVPRQYDEHADGTVTMTCAKFNDELPALGGYDVFGMKPEDLEEVSS